MKHVYIYISILFMCFNTISAQEILQQASINRTDQTIKIDGVLDDNVWNKTQSISDLYLKYPNLESNASPRTEIKLCYDNKNIYLSAICYQNSKPIIQSLKRDTKYWNGDGLAILLDPTGGRKNGFFFGTNPYGTQVEALISDGNNSFNENWDNKWLVETKIDSNYWTIEMAIPFTTLRYNKEQINWGVNFIRNVTGENEYHTWTPIPQQFEGTNLGYTGSLTFSDGLQAPKRNISITPYSTLNMGKEIDEKANSDINFGADAKIALNSSLNLDLTVNPDFSQVEVDEQLTNLSRFSIFLPEKRAFFIENSDLFNNYGIPPIRPFFSRAIGLEDGESVPIKYGLRLTGNLSESTRIGAMNVHTDNDSIGQNYTALSLMKNIGKRSYIKAIFLNKQGFNQYDAIKGNYGRNIGMEGAYVSDSGNFSIWAGAFKSIKKDFSNKSLFFNFGTRFSNERWSGMIAYSRLQENFYTDMGFVTRVENYDALRDTTIRVGFQQSYSFLEYRLFTIEHSLIHTQKFKLENYIVLNPNFSFNERNTSIRYQLLFNNNSDVSISATNHSNTLLFPYSFTDDIPLPVESYNYNQLSLDYSSDNRKVLKWNTRLSTGGFYNGTIKSAKLGLDYRVQPWGSFGLNFEYNDLNFPEPYGRATINAISSKIEIAITKDIFWTNLFQYVQQNDFLGINSKIQWRFAPLSDLYLVYIDNYKTLDYSKSNFLNIESEERKFILKVNYWITI